MKNHLSNALKGTHFYSMPVVPYDILFKRQSIKNDCYIEDKLYKAPLALVKRAFFPDLKKIDYEMSSSAKILFYMSDPDRKSSEVNFLKAVSTVDNPDVIVERRGNPHFSFLGFYLFFYLMPIWCCQMIGKGLTIIEKYLLLKSLLEVYRVWAFFRKIDIKKYNLLVCYYDSIVHECMLNLMFKKEGVTTATLQHGQFNAWREPKYINCGLELMSSPSNFFLCWNKFTQDQALKCGWSKDKLPIVGILGNIGKGEVRCKSPFNRIFGVVLSHPSFEKENFDMIKAANILAESIGYKYYLKLHPNYKEDYFTNVVDDSYYIGNVVKGLDTLEYTNMVEFSIVGSSSVYVEMVYFYHDILKYSTGLPSDKYLDINYGAVFHNKEEIVKCYHNLSVNDKETLFNYLCHSYDTEKCYRRFFEKFS